MVNNGPQWAEIPLRRRRPKEPGSQRSLATASGVPRTTIQRMERQLALCERFPFMKNWSQSRVLKVGEFLKRFSPKEQAAIITILEGHEHDPKTAIAWLRKMYGRL